MLQKFGADALRLYVMFVAPPETQVEWNDSGLNGMSDFLGRVWRIVGQCCAAGKPSTPMPPLDALTIAERGLRRKTHDTIRRVTTDIDVRMHFNTAVAAMMELVNELYAFTRTQATEPSPHAATVAREAVEALTVMLSPFAPHTAEELWERLGHQGGIIKAAWPAFDAEAAKALEIVIPVQVNGKVRGRVTASPNATDSELRDLALADPGVRAHTEGKTVNKVVVALGRLVSIVVR